MKINKRKLRQLILETMNFDQETGEPLTPQGFEMYTGRDEEAKQLSMDAINNALKMVQETIKSSYGGKISSIFSHGIMTAMQGKTFDKQTSLNAYFELYKLGKKSSDSIDIGFDTDPQVEKNKRLQKMVDMIGDDPDAEFFKRQIK